jgi:hypothetical protein
LFWWSGDVRLLWWCAWPALLLLHMVGVARGPGPAPQHVSKTKSERALLWSLALACAVLTLLAHRPNADDALYVNLAVQVADHPAAPLLRDDGLFGIVGAPLQRPVYRVHSLEVLAGAVSWLTGAPPILVLHWGVAAGAAFLLPLVHARLLRRLLPDAWLLATFFSVLILWRWGGHEAAYGNFAFVRLWQGKAILAAVLVPWLLAELLDHLDRPGGTNLLGLGAAVVAGIGLSASGLIVVSVVLAAGILGAWRPRWERTRRCLAATLLLLYPLAWILLLREGLHGATAARPAMAESVPLIESVISHGLGTGPRLAFALFAAHFAWNVVGKESARAMTIVLPLALWLVALSPHWSSSLASQLESPALYERLLWIFPLPVFLGITLAAPAVLMRHWGYPRAGSFVSLLLSGTLVFVLPTIDTLSTENGTRLAWPGPKVPPAHYEAARLLVDGSPAGSSVLAPEPVATWVTTFRGHPHPLYSRQIYDFQLRRDLGLSEANRRRSLSFSADAGASLDYRRVSKAVDDYDLAAVCCRATARSRRPTMLQECGFELVGRRGEYEVWTRAQRNQGGAATDGGDDRPLDP